MVTVVGGGQGKHKTYGGGRLRDRSPEREGRSDDAMQGESGCVEGGGWLVVVLAGYGRMRVTVGRF